MGVFGSALGAIGFQVRQVRQAPPRRRTSMVAGPPWMEAGHMELWQYKTDVSAFRGYAEKYARSSTEYMAVTKTIEAIGMAGMEKLRVFPSSRPWQKVDPLEDHMLYELLVEPNPMMTQFEFFEALGGWAEVAGNAYVYIHMFDNGLPHSLWILPSMYVRPETDKKRGLTGYTYTVNSEDFSLPAEKVMHIRRWNPLDPYVGLSPSEATVVAAATDISMQNYNRVFFRHGARPSVILESDREEVRDPTVIALMERMFEERHTGGAEQMGKPMFTWGGFRAKEFSTSQRDAEFVEGRKVNRTDIWGVRGVHPGLITAEDVNRSNAEVAEYLFAAYTLWPRLVRIAGQFNKDLMPLFGDDARVGFVDVVPRDVEQEARVAVDKARAALILLKGLGPQEGVAEAQRLGLLSEGVDVVRVVEQAEGAPSVAELMSAEAGTQISKGMFADRVSSWLSPAERLAMEQALEEHWRSMEVLAESLPANGHVKEPV